MPLKAAPVRQSPVRCRLSFWVRRRETGEGGFLDVLGVRGQGKVRQGAGRVREVGRDAGAERVMGCEMWGAVVQNARGEGDELVAHNGGKMRCAGCRAVPLLHLMGM